MKKSILIYFGCSLMLLSILSCTQQKQATEDFNLGMICPGKKQISAKSTEEKSKNLTPEEDCSVLIKKETKTEYHFTSIGMRNVRAYNATKLIVNTFDSAGSNIQVIFQSVSNN